MLSGVWLCRNGATTVCKSNAGGGFLCCDFEPFLMPDVIIAKVGCWMLGFQHSAR